MSRAFLFFFIPEVSLQLTTTDIAIETNLYSINHDAQMPLKHSSTTMTRFLLWGPGGVSSLAVWATDGSSLPLSLSHTSWWRTGVTRCLSNPCVALGGQRGAPHSLSGLKAESNVSLCAAAAPRPPKNFASLVDLR